MEVTQTKLDGVLLVKPPTVFEDFRGTYVELYNEELYKATGINVHFLQDDISMSSQHVLRGIHGDAETWKLVSCLHGKFYLVVINWDEKSQQYRQWESFTLSEQNRLQVLIPPKFGNGHVVSGTNSRTGNISPCTPANIWRSDKNFIPYCLNYIGLLNGF